MREEELVEQLGRRRTTRLLVPAHLSRHPVEAIAQPAGGPSTCACASAATAASAIAVAAAAAAAAAVLQPAGGAT